MFSETNIKIDGKADKKHTHSIADVTDLETTLDKKLEATDITGLSTKIDTNATEISNMKNIANANSNSISGLVNAFDKKADKSDLDNKADKKHTHAINDVDGLRNTLDNHERIFNSNIGSISNLSDKLQYKASTDSVAELEKKVNGKADKTDLSSLEAKVNNLSTDKISDKNGHGNLSFWTGTQNEYNKISSKDINTIYFITE